jgi:putative FmdB family regulatory protein
MPTYQYRCEKCGQVFDHVEHVAEHEAASLHEQQPADLRCPKCGSEAIQHQPTKFFARTSKKS